VFTLATTRLRNSGLIWGCDSVEDSGTGRTKELERLMVSVEDAEAYTERHNMLHFLMRDTAQLKPVGYESQISNLFDPADNNGGANESSEKRVKLFLVKTTALSLRFVLEKVAL
jgi:hypothetical protein